MLIVIAPSNNNESDFNFSTIIKSQTTMNKVIHHIYTKKVILSQFNEIHVQVISKT